MLLAMGLGAALAAGPEPDRPYISRTGYLVAPDTLEQELGLAFADQRSVPSTLKYAFGRMAEIRLSADLGGVRQGQPSLVAGTKLAVRQSRLDALAIWFGSTLPVPGAGERWEVQAHALMSRWLARELRLRLNVGVDLRWPDTGLREGADLWAGIPLSTAITLKPTRAVGVITEVAGHIYDPQCIEQEFDCIYGRVIFNLGVRADVTDHLAADLAVGYRFVDTQLFVTMGLTANFGRFK